VDVRGRFWIETVLAAVSGLLFLLTAAWHDWIEIVFGVEPDGGNGVLEWAFVGLSLLVFITFTMLARAEWRRAAPAD
jgi:hypothetical protein